jgi:nucleoside-diphosphate-sugar epimerase
VAEDNRRVGITGAAGFVGRAVVDRFRADGWDVVGIDRTTAEGVHPADIRERGAWQERLRGCTIVVHTAALVSQTASRTDAWVANVVGTRNVIDGLGPGARLVHFSSAAVYSPRKPVQVDERFPVRPTGRTYGDTKIASEQVALAAHVAGEADVVIVRPSDVYGAGSRPWTEVPIAALRAGRLVLPAHGHGQVDPVYIDDLVDGVLAAALVPHPVSRVYNLAGGHPVTAREFFGEYSRRLALHEPRTTSTGVATVVAEAMGRVQRWRGAPSELGAGAVAMLAKTGSCSPERARRELDWVPRVSLDEGMRRTVAACAAAASDGRGSG